MSKKLILIGLVTVSVAIGCVINLPKETFNPSSVLEENLQVLCEGGDTHLYWRHKEDGCKENRGVWFNPKNNSYMDTIVSYDHTIKCKNPTELHLNKCTNYPVREDYYEKIDIHYIEQNYECTMEPIE